MEVHSPSDVGCEPDAALKAVIDTQFPDRKDRVTYLNTGSVGRKPTCVVDALNRGVKQLNTNPTLTSFLDPEPLGRARQLAASIFACDSSSLLLTGNSTQGLQLILESFLTKPGDELVLTNHEHGSVRTIVRYLEETRGITVRTYDVPRLTSSEQFCFGVLSYVNERTRLVLVSEVDCYTGWRPDLTTLVDSLELLGVPVLVDGAHAPGHVKTRPGRYPLWVGSGHKWLGGPNGTGFAYVTRELIPHLEPVWLGDQFFEKRDNEVYDISRFECRGTSDVCQWFGLAAAIELYAGLNYEHVRAHQSSLVNRLRNALAERFPVNFRTPSPEQVPADECTAILAFSFPAEKVMVNDLRAALWDNDLIWVQPENLHDIPGHGMRVSCHYSVTSRDIDKLVDALTKYVETTR